MLARVQWERDSFQRSLPYDYLDEFKYWLQPENYSHFPQYLETAVKYRAYQCIAAILDENKQTTIIKQSEIELLAEAAAESADGQMVLVLENNNFEKAAARLFSKRMPDAKSEASKNEQFSLYLQTLLRYMPIATVDLLMETFAKTNGAIKNIFCGRFHRA